MEKLNVGKSMRRRRKYFTNTKIIFYSIVVLVIFDLASDIEFSIKNGIHFIDYHSDDVVEETHTIPNIEFTNLNVTIATWDYFPLPPKNNRVESNNIISNTTKLTMNCSALFNDVKADESLQILSPSEKRKRRSKDSNNNACNGYNGILVIQHGDVYGASGTIFFQFMVGILRWAEQHNYKPWIHFNNHSLIIYDSNVHSKGGDIITFEMLDGMEIGWARDDRDPYGYIFPGKPQLAPGISKLALRNFTFTGTGVWEHYFEPINDFIPDGEDKSCLNKPLITMNVHHILPGLHSHAPWAPHGWRYWMPEYIQQPWLSHTEWITPQRRNASQIVQRYIKFNSYMEQRASCILLRQQREDRKVLLGIHIRNGDKYPSRNIIPTKKFLPFCKVFLEKFPEGEGYIYLATDSALVYDEIQTQWPSNVTKRIIMQPSVQGLSRTNGQAAFDITTSSKFGHHRTNIEALTDILVLSKCNYLIHGWSAMTEAAMYLNPNLVSIDLEYDPSSTKKKENSHKEKLRHFRKEIT